MEVLNFLVGETDVAVRKRGDCVLAGGERWFFFIRWPRCLGSSFLSLLLLLLLPFVYYFYCFDRLL
jgi:hypothetical protein